MNTPNEPTIHIETPGYVSSDGQHPPNSSKVWVINDQGQPTLIGTVSNNTGPGLQIRLLPNISPSLLRSVGINKAQYSGFIEVEHTNYSWGKSR